MVTLLGSHNLAYHFSSLSIKIPGNKGMVRWHRDLGDQYISPGDIVFMHPKTRHCSGQNDSDKPRINLIMQVGIAKRPLSQKINNKEHFGIGRLQLKQDGGYQ